MARTGPCVFIPTLNRRTILLRTLHGLAEQTVAAEVVVVDNGSSDGSVQAVRREYPDVHVLELGRNRGFGPALNEAVARYPAERLIFSNNDVQHEPQFVEALVDEVAPSTGSVAGVLLQDRDPCLIDSAGVVVDSTLLAFDYLHGLPDSIVASAQPPLGPTGGAALVTRTAFATVGGFDARIFAYLEDVDLALRLRAAGFRCRLSPHARAIHQHSATLGSGSRAKNHLMGWSRGYLLRRYGVLRRPRRAARALAAETVICAGQLVIDRNASGVAGRIRGWKAARGLPPLEVAPDATLDITLAEALRRRSRRRSPRHAAVPAPADALSRSE